jgi:hypothetical protein
LTRESSFNLDSMEDCPLMMGKACIESIQVMYKKVLYSGTSVHELNPFLEAVRKPKLFFP